MTVLPSVWQKAKLSGRSLASDGLIQRLALSGLFRQIARRNTARSINGINIRGRCRWRGRPWLPDVLQEPRDRVIDPERRVWGQRCESIREQIEQPFVVIVGCDIHAFEPRHLLAICRLRIDASRHPLIKLTRITA